MMLKVVKHPPRIVDVRRLIATVLAKKVNQVSEGVVEVVGCDCKDVHKLNMMGIEVAKISN